MVNVSIGKDSGNVGFVYQRHYSQVLINEIGLNKVNNTRSTHTKGTKTVDETVSDTSNIISEK